MKKVLAIIGLVIGGLALDAAAFVGIFYLLIFYGGWGDFEMVMSALIVIAAVAVISPLLNLLRKKICGKLKMNLGIFLLCTQLLPLLGSAALTIYGVSTFNGSWGDAFAVAAIIACFASDLSISAGIAVSAGISKFRADIKNDPDGYRP